MLRLYDYLPSQNGFKVRMLLEDLGSKWEHVPVRIFQGESRTPEFLEMNPAGAVPVLEVETGTYIAESNAILCYLAEGSELLPKAATSRAKVLQWLFFEQYNVEATVGSLRFWTLTGRLKLNQPLIAAKRNAGERALDALERHLERHEFLANDTVSIADISVFSYSHVAEDAQFELSSRPALGRWIARVRTRFARLPEVYPYTADAMVA